MEIRSQAVDVLLDERELLGGLWGYLLSHLFVALSDKTMQTPHTFTACQQVHADDLP